MSQLPETCLSSLRRGTAANRRALGSANGAAHPERCGPKGVLQGLGSACDGHALRSGLLAVCECNGPCPQRPPERVRRAQAPSARSVFGTRQDVTPLQPLRPKPPHPSPMPAC
jgi:hypothetical protein